MYRNKLHTARQSDVLVLGAKFRSPEFRGSPRTRKLNRGTPCQKRQLEPIRGHNWGNIGYKLYYSLIEYRMWAFDRHQNQ